VSVEGSVHPPGPLDPVDVRLDETTIVARAKAGNPQAFERLVDRYQTAVFRYTYRMVEDRGTAEEVVQETFVAAWRGLPALADPAAFRGWLYRIATRRAFDVLRAPRPYVGLPPEDDEPARAVGNPTATSVDPAQVTVQRAQVRALQQALTTLPPQQRAAWTMRTLEGLSYEEIATALNLPVSTVRGRIARARQSLAEKMSPWR
jgi:RNA polymerase sigma-70 factor (ECF subfamily)